MMLHYDQQGGYPDFTDPLVRIGPEAGECWKWLGPTNTKGYGKLWDRGRNKTAHRVTYAVFVRPLTDDEKIDHLCRNHRCVNPKHLEPVTTAENLYRGNTYAAKNRIKTHCPRGHAYEGSNLRVNIAGSRECRTCGALKAAKYRARKRLAESNNNGKH